MDWGRSRWPAARGRAAVDGQGGRVFRGRMRRLWQRTGMLGVLGLLVLIFSLVTLRQRPAEGAAGGEALARAHGSSGAFLILAAGGGSREDDFLRGASAVLDRAGVTATVVRSPAEARTVMESAPAQERAILASPAAARWAVFDAVRGQVRTPTPGRESIFLTRSNLLNILNQISVIAILAAGMTLVILTRGIDLSVGSLLALGAVVCAWLLERRLGGPAAGPGAMWLAAGGAVAACALAGALSGAMVAFFGIPPFIATLAMMLIGSGAAFLISGGESIYQLPESFVWLGRGSALGLPNAVWLTLILYGGAHVLLERSVPGRHLRALGSNPEAARFSGLPLVRLRLTVYILSGALAGVGGIVTASQLKSGAPTYGLMYELYAIAAVVVGGTSLSGGRGGIPGTLVGALIIAVIQNGMNLTGVESYTQKVVLGAVILLAVLVDRAAAGGEARGG